MARPGPALGRRREFAEESENLDTFVVEGILLGHPEYVACVLRYKEREWIT